jgi:hypothetical protein
VNNFGGDGSVATPGRTMERLADDFLAMKIAQVVTIYEGEGEARSGGVFPRLLMPPSHFRVMCCVVCCHLLSIVLNPVPQVS